MRVLAIIEVDRQNLGEDRFQAFGLIDDLAHCLVFLLNVTNPSVPSACVAPLQRKLNDMSKARKNSDSPTWTSADFERAVRLDGVSLADAVATLRRGRGPQVKPKKVAISIRISPKIIDHFKADGAGWQARMEKVLLKASGIKEL